MKLTTDQTLHLNRVFGRHTLQPTVGGYMSYSRALLVKDNQTKCFIKAYDRALHAKEYHAVQAKFDLQKEAHMYRILMYRILTELSFPYVPSNYVHTDEMIYMTALSPEDGWHWQAPIDNTGAYITEVIEALDELEALDIKQDIPDKEVHDYFLSFGWQKINQASLQTTIIGHVKQARTDCEARLVQRLFESHTNFRPAVCELIAQHHDARQDNIAWHPIRGVRIVDWSWTGYGLPGADKTMFLIDLHKHEVDITEYKQNINVDHLLLMIGYYLVKSTESSTPNQAIVRQEQLDSALAAIDILYFC